MELLRSNEYDCNDLVFHVAMAVIVSIMFVCLFDLILYVPSTIFQLYRDGSSWDEPVLS